MSKVVNNPGSKTIFKSVAEHLSFIYPELDIDQITSQAIDAISVSPTQEVLPQHKNKWSEKDAWVITYGDTLNNNDEAPLRTLKRFSDT